MINRIAGPFLVLFAATCIAGCGHERGQPMHSGNGTPLTYGVASRTAQKYAEDAFESAFSSSASLAKDSSAGGFALVTYCSNSDNPPKGTSVHVEFDYKVNGVHKDIKSYFARFQKTLTQEGWDHVDGSFQEDHLTMRKDGYTIVLAVAGENVSLSVQTPCVPPKDPDHPLNP